LKKNKKQLSEYDQLRIEALDHNLWISTPLGKFVESVKTKKRELVSKLTPKTSADFVYRPREWVIRVPGSCALDRLKKNGLQTVVWAEDEDQAMDVAVEKNEWEILDFPVRWIACFPKRPFFHD